MALKRQRINILGVKVDDISQKDAVDAILKLALSKNIGHYVVTVNTENLMLARRDPNFARIVKCADLCVADGYWTVKSKLVLGGTVQDRVTGVDLVEKVCGKIGDLPITVGFLGGFGRVADMVKKRQLLRNPGLIVKISEPGDPTIGYDLRLKKQILRLGGVDILFVAYGMGQQEYWIERNRKKLDVGVFIGVGGALDYISGVKRRAPDYMQAIGLEWLWRLGLEPWRIWRMRVLPVFLMFVLWDWIRFLFKGLLNRQFSR